MRIEVFDSTGVAADKDEASFFLGPSPSPCPWSWSNLGIVVAVGAVVLVAVVSSRNKRSFCQEAAAVRMSP